MEMKWILKALLNMSSLALLKDLEGSFKSDLSQHPPLNSLDMSFISSFYYHLHSGDSIYVSSPNYSPSTRLNLDNIIKKLMQN